MGVQAGLHGAGRAGRVQAGLRDMGRAAGFRQGWGLQAGLGGAGRAGGVHVRPWGAEHVRGCPAGRDVQGHEGVPARPPAWSRCSGKPGGSQEA